MQPEVGVVTNLLAAGHSIETSDDLKIIDDHTN